MPEHQVTFARSARKELEALPTRTASRVLAAIVKLVAVPRPHGSRKIQGSDNLLRIRVGDYRVIYGVSNAARVVDIIAVRHRRDAYR